MSSNKFFFVIVAGILLTTGNQAFSMNWLFQDEASEEDQEKKLKLSEEVQKKDSEKNFKEKVSPSQILEKNDDNSCHYSILWDQYLENQAFEVLYNELKQKSDCKSLAVDNFIANNWLNKTISKTYHPFLLFISLRNRIKNFEHESISPDVVLEAIKHIFLCIALTEVDEYIMVMLKESNEQLLSDWLKQKFLHEDTKSAIKVCVNFYGDENVLNVARSFVVQKLNELLERNPNVWHKPFWVKIVHGPFDDFGKVFANVFQTAGMMNVGFRGQIKNPNKQYNQYVTEALHKEIKFLEELKSCNDFFNNYQKSSVSRANIKGANVLTSAALTGIKSFF